MVPDPQKQTKMSVAFLLPDVSADPVVNLSLAMISSLLLDGPKAPLYQALLDSNIGSDYAPSTGFDNGTREPVFAVGLQVRKHVL